MAVVVNPILLEVFTYLERSQRVGELQLNCHEASSLSIAQAEVVRPAHGVVDLGEWLIDSEQLLGDLV